MPFPIGKKADDANDLIAKRSRPGLEGIDGSEDRDRPGIFLPSLTDGEYFDIHGRRFALANVGAPQSRTVARPRRAMRLINWGYESPASTADSAKSSSGAAI